jgi:zinc transport system substrate-binding protein
MQTPARLFLFGLLAAGCLPACSRAPAPDETANQTDVPQIPTVTVVNYPLKYFAERIGGADVQVVFPAPEDEDPAYWTPDAESIVAYQQADLILLNGASYAKWIAIASLPEAKTVDTSASVADQYIAVEGTTTHAHGPEGEHAHGGVAFTTWLDPQLAILQARAIADAMSARWPDRQQQFTEGFTSLEQDLLELDAALQEALSGAKDLPLVFSHPVYQYLERRYGLNGESVHWEPDEPPSDEQWNELTELLSSHPAKWMIWEGEPGPATVTRLSELGLGSVVSDPCGNTPEAGDYLDVMQDNAARLRDALPQQAAEAEN